jgi:hypothetical protein
MVRGRMIRRRKRDARATTNARFQHAGKTVDQKSRRAFVFMDLEAFSNRAKCRLEFRGWRRWVRVVLKAARGVWKEMLQGRLKLDGMAAFVWSELRRILNAGAQIRNWGAVEQGECDGAVVRMRRFPPASADFGAPAQGGDA